MIDNLLYCIAQHIRVFIRRVHSLRVLQKVVFIVSSYAKGHVLCCHSELLRVPVCLGAPKGSVVSVFGKNAIRQNQRPVREPFIFQTVQPGCHGLYKKKCFIRKLLEWKQVFSQGEKWSEALTKRKTDRHIESSLLLSEPGCTDMASLTLVASTKFTAMYGALSKLHTFCHCCHTSCINIFCGTDEKRSAALLARYLKNVGTDSIYHTTRIHRSNTRRGVTQHVCACL